VTTATQLTDAVAVVCAVTGAERKDVIATMVESGKWPLSWRRLLDAGAKRP
jgi:6-phosphogluconolactonase/glucosamine-6-phosphate isomerase/deaminase